MIIFNTTAGSSRVHSVILCNNVNIKYKKIIPCILVDYVSMHKPSKSYYQGVFCSTEMLPPECI